MGLQNLQRLARFVRWSQVAAFLYFFGFVNYIYFVRPRLEDIPDAPTQLAICTFFYMFGAQALYWIIKYAIRQKQAGDDAAARKGRPPST